LASYKINHLHEFARDAVARSKPDLPVDSLIDEEQVQLDAQTIELLRRIYLFLLFVIFPSILLNQVFNPAPTLFVMPLVPLLITLGMRWCLRNGRASLAIGLLQWGLFLGVLLQCFALNGLRTPVALIFPVLLILVGWMRGRKDALIALAVTVACVSVMAIFDERWWPVQVQRHTYYYWLALVLGSGLATLLAVHIAEASRRASARNRAANAQLALQLDELKHARDRLTALSNVNPMPISISRVEDGSYIDVNPAWVRLSGWSRAEALGRRSTDMNFWVGAQDRESFAKAANTSDGLFNYPIRFRMRDGSVRDFLISAERIDYDGELAIFAVFVDVTALRQAETALAQLNSELEARVAERTASLRDALSNLQRAQEELVQSDKLASLGSVVAGVAHELNTPIGNSVLLASTLSQDLHALQEAFHAGTLRKSEMERYVADAERAAGLLELSLARASHLVASFKQVAIDQSSERRRRFALHELVWDICETMRAGMRQPDWTLDCSLVPDLQMDSYPGPLGQVISNLVQNAFLHGLQEHTTGRVHVGMRRLDENTLELSVSDDGRGIEPEIIGRIFDPFFTTRLGQGGSGLGLSIVYRLVTNLLGGRISVESAPGQGSCFTICLPAVASSQG
jgi:PAS domain S-box-containing protein